MASLNKVMLIGNLTRDPEVRYTPKGSAVADLAIAVNRSYQTDNGERMEEVTYVDIVVWARLAELAGQYLHKGRAVFVEGRLQMDSWEDKATGQKRSRLRVVAENLQFLDSKPGGGRGNDEADQAGGNQGGGGQGGPPAQQRRPMGGGASGGGGGGGGGYQQRPASGSAQRPPQRQQPASQEEEFGEGPITEGMEEDDIPF
ncbi:MAG: single-stranded DNA-binding protein [Prosthecobacter sp.]|nr:single-stranded DNA-binding protein [Prosthecobacter sp.]